LVREAKRTFVCEYAAGFDEFGIEVPAAMSLLAAQALTVTARIGGAAVPVIRNLDFALAPGKILGLVGESGAGNPWWGARSRSCCRRDLPSRAAGSRSRAKTS
jgi:hypothetical protein